MKNPSTFGRFLIFSAIWLVFAQANGASLVWNTFSGGPADDDLRGMVVDSLGNSYVTGASLQNWGTPIQPLQGVADAFLAKIDTDGNLVWNTFVGGAGNDGGNGVALDALGNILITGTSDQTW